MSASIKINPMTSDNASSRNLDGMEIKRYVRRVII